MNNNLIKWPFKQTILIVLALFLNGLLLQAQEPLNVEGVVISPENKPVANVTVSVEGSDAMPAFTNENGEFQVEAESGNVWLRIAPASQYKSKRVFLDGRKNLRIMLTPDDVYSGNNELIVFSQTKLAKNIISSFSDVNIENVHHSITTSIDNYMQGRVSGINVTRNSGQPGSGSMTLTRGVNSLNASNQPLYIVDGMIMVPGGLFGSVIDGYVYNPLTSVNPMDISSVSVLKDATYSAAYGSKASNGMIV
ncbi:MAG TPA: TonB-dependent receptor plug domain-containing protein, partial [Bacteroidales bacterium]|nr:TonB-dependent receptor plug domain-containing protein [Bacteroidales bacterium]